MIDRGVMGHGLVALICGAFALSAWVRDGAAVSDAIIVEGSAADLQEVRWQDSIYHVTILRDPENGNSEALRVRINSSKVPGITKSYAGTAQAVTLFEHLSPLKAVRRLGQVDEERLAALGLAPLLAAEPEGVTVANSGVVSSDATKDLEPARLTLLHKDGRETSVRIGNATFGSSNRYALVNGELVLMKSNTLSGLYAGATTLLDRRVARWKPADVAAIEIGAGGVVRSFTQRHREHTDKAFFSDPAVPDEKLGAVTNFVDRLLKLRVANQRVGKPSGTVRLRAVFYGDGKKELGTIELYAILSGAEVAKAWSSAFAKNVTLELAKVDAEHLLSDVDEVLREGL